MPSMRVPASGVWAESTKQTFPVQQPPTELCVQMQERKISLAQDVGYICRVV